MSQQQPAWEPRSLHVDRVEEKTVCGESKDPVCTKDLRPLKVRVNLEDSTQQVSMKKGPGMKRRRCNSSLSDLTPRFMALLRSSPEGVLDLNKAAEALGIPKRRLYDVTNVLSGIKLVEKKSRSHIQWIGPDLNELEIRPKQRQLEAELLDLSAKEASLDELIKDCSQQWNELLADREKKRLAYVSYEDIHSLDIFREQTVVAVKSPPDTSLDLLIPLEGSVSLNMKSTTGPIDVYVCEMAEDLSSNETSDGVGSSSSESTQPEHPHPEKEEDPPEQSEELIEVKTNGM